MVVSLWLWWGEDPVLGECCCCCCCCSLDVWPWLVGLAVFNPFMNRVFASSLIAPCTLSSFRSVRQEAEISFAQDSIATCWGALIFRDLVADSNLWKELFLFARKMNLNLSCFQSTKVRWINRVIRVNDNSVRYIYIYIFIRIYNFERMKSRSLKYFCFLKYKFRTTR